MSSPEDKDSEDVPEGMVRRTRRVRKKRKSKKSTTESQDHADTLFAKAKDLLIGMEENDEEQGHVDLAEQIRRLKKKKEDDRPLDDIWGSKKRSTSWLWIVLAGLIVSVVFIMIGVNLWISDDSANKGDQRTMISSVGILNEVDLSEGPLGWFNENSIEALDEAKRIIGILNRAESSEELKALVRASPNRGSAELDLSLWGAEGFTNPTSNFRWTPKVVNSSARVGGSKRGFLSVSGSRSDFTPYQAYFVESENRVLLDWDATIGWSEMTVAQIAQTRPKKEIFLRCRVTKKTSFDQNFDGVEHSGYVISGEIHDDYFSAFIPMNTDRGRAIDRDLWLLLKYRSFVSMSPPLENQKATLRVRFNSEIGKKGVFEIVEFLHDGWVSP